MLAPRPVLLLSIILLAVVAASAAPTKKHRRLFPRQTTSTDATQPLNAFADGAAADTSSPCAAARACVASWQNVTDCFGPALRLFYATPDNVCLGKCREVTVQAASMVAGACASASSTTTAATTGSGGAAADSSFAGFGAGGAVTERIQADIYRIWANQTAADIACAQVPAGAATRLGESSVASVESVSPSANDPVPPKTYVLEVVLNAYTAWQSTSSVPAGANAPMDSSLRASQCTPIVQDFWRNWKGSPAEVPQLYYWSMPDSSAYVAALEQLCGSDFFSAPSAVAAIADIAPTPAVLVIGRPTITVTMAAATLSPTY